MRFSAFSRLFFMGCAAVLFSVSAAQSAEQIVLSPMTVDETSGGNIEVRPTLSAGTQMDTNYYKSPDDEREVITYLVQPGIQISYQTPKSILSFLYTMNNYYYQDLDDVPAGQKDASDDDYMGHTLDFKFETTPFSKLTFLLKDRFTNTRQESEAEDFSNDIRKDKYTINRLSPGVLYRISERFSTGLQYRNTITSYDGSSASDSKENRGIYNFDYNFSKVSSLGLNYQIWDKDYDEEINSDFLSNEVGLVYRRTGGKFAMEAGAGYHTRDYDFDEMDDTDTFTYRMALIGQLPKTRATLMVSENFNEGANPGDLYTARRVSLKAQQLITQKISADLKASYNWKDYERWAESVNLDQSREDDTYRVSAGISYKLAEWLSFNLNGGYEQRDSSLEDYDYDNAFVSLGFSSSYALID